METKGIKRDYLALFALLALWIGLAFPSLLSAAESLPKDVLRFADTVLFNGKVVTADKDFAIAEAVAIRDGKIIATGRSANILRMADQNTRRIDLEGKTVIPGIIDSHSHLFDYALNRWGKDVEALEPNLRDFKPRTIEGKSVEEVMAKLKVLMTTIESGRWTQVLVRPEDVANEMWNKLSIEDIDRISPNHPLIVRTAGTRRFYNSKVREAVRKRFGQDFTALVDRDGKYSGRGGAGPIRSIMVDVMIQNPMKSLAQVFRKEMEVWASKGVTTWSSVLSGLANLNVYGHLDRRGEMPIRFAYSHGMGDTNFPHSIGFYERLGDMAGHGTPHLWSIGVSPGALGCLSPILSPHFKRPENCDYVQGKERRAEMIAKVKAGLRIAGNHVVGDIEADNFMDILEEGSKEAGLSLDEIRAKRHVMDHCSFHPNLAQVERAKRMGIIFSCAPVYIERDVSAVKPSGYEYVHRLSAPIKRILDGGAKVVVEFDNENIGSKEGNVFKELLIFVNRKDSQGRVWGAEQAVDRKTALLMATRWSAEYVLREDVLGSLEPGKWADLLILDQDFLNASEADLARTKVLLTLVAGKIAYTEPSFAAVKGLPQVGYREK